MTRPSDRRMTHTKPIVGLLIVACLVSANPCAAQDDGLSEKAVLSALKLGQQALVNVQLADGSWPDSAHPVGATALITLALLNAGMDPDERSIRRALEFLRKDSSNAVYEISLKLMVFAFVKDRDDRIRMRSLVQKLEDGQVRGGGPQAGCWAYTVTGGIGGGDHSNGQFAVLGLFEAANAGISVSRTTWELAESHWRNTQNADGGWGYSANQGNSSIGSMTVAGIASLVMTTAMLQKDEQFQMIQTSGLTPKYYVKVLFDHAMIKWSF